MYSGMYSTIQSPVVRTEDPSHKDPREGVCARQQYLPFDIPRRLHGVPKKILIRPRDSEDLPRGMCREHSRRGREGFEWRRGYDWGLNVVAPYRLNSTLPYVRSNMVLSLEGQEDDGRR